jgi:hypothetical protein
MRKLIENGCQKSSKMIPNGGLGRPRARFLRFWEALEKHDFLKILWSGKSWYKICKNAICGGQGGERAQLLVRVGERGAALGSSSRGARIWMNSGLDLARSRPCKQGAADLQGSALPADPQEVEGREWKYLRSTASWGMGSFWKVNDGVSSYDTRKDYRCFSLVCLRIHKNKAMADLLPGMYRRRQANIDERINRHSSEGVPEKEIHQWRPTPFPCIKMESKAINKCCKMEPKATEGC